MSGISGIWELPISFFTYGIRNFRIYPSMYSSDASVTYDISNAAWTVDGVAGETCASPGYASSVSYQMRYVIIFHNLFLIVNYLQA